jgi:DNA-binding Lrp family transcriptional regulator
MSLDRIDFEILLQLQRDARMSNKELAAAIGVAPSTCLLRVQRLMDSGVLRGFHADVDPEALGIGLQAMSSVRLSNHAKVSFQNLKAELLQVPEIVAVYLMAGSQDLLIHLVVKDVAQLRDLLARLVAQQPNIAHIETSLILEHVPKRVLPCYQRIE